MSVRCNVTVQMTSPSWSVEEWKNSPCSALHQTSKLCKLYFPFSWTRLLETLVGIQMIYMNSLTNSFLERFIERTENQKSNSIIPKKKQQQKNQIKSLKR